MPKLLLFAPCEKVIVNQFDNNTSLISLLEALTISVSAPDAEIERIPSDASAPISWYLIALWKAETSADVETTWLLRFILKFPSGEEKNVGGEDTIMKFEPKKPNHRCVINVVGFPIKPAIRSDICTAVLLLKQEGDSDWRVIAEFPIILKH